MGVFLRWVLIVVSILLVSATVGCNGERYQLGETEDGETIRLDTKTGEVMIIYGTRMVRVESPEERTPVSEEQKQKIAAENAEWKARRAWLTEPKDWPTLTIPGVGSERANLTTKLDGMYIHYKFSVEPVPRWLNRDSSYWPQNPFTLMFYDDDDCQILVGPIWSSSCVTSVDDSGNRTRITAQGKIMCSGSSDYENIARWSFGWNK